MLSGSESRSKVKDPENTFYSAMLNIAELVPPPESVPIPFHSEIHGISFDSGIPSDSALS